MVYFNHQVTTRPRRAAAMKTLTANATKFLSHNPTKLRQLASYSVYENPLHGEEGSARVITPEGKLKFLPDGYVPDSLEELIELLQWQRRNKGK